MPSVLKLPLKLLKPSKIRSTVPNVLKSDNIKVLSYINLATPLIKSIQKLSITLLYKFHHSSLSSSMLSLFESEELSCRFFFFILYCFPMIFFCCTIVCCFARSNIIFYFASIHDTVEIGLNFFLKFSDS